MKSYFAYIRVSTVKQGERGSSLQEQKAAIEAYATRNDLRIAEWFEETETAAKQGRRQFARLTNLLRSGKAAGVIIHKIDRSARNLKDWAGLGDLIDAGVEVLFAHEALDLSTRGGRLAADIQAVVAADFIRNLREETRKGFYGRLKQGFFPLRAPRGYLDRGKARAKEICPVVGPLVRQAFELYGTGTYSLETLRHEMRRRGLRSSSGGPLSFQALSSLLRNPFYIGLMRIHTTSETFPGNHAPLVSKTLFDRVQAIMDGRLYPRIEKHTFLFRRLVTCATCGRSLSGERQKGRVYYRCHDRACSRVCVREDRVEQSVLDALGALALDERDVRDLRDLFHEQMQRERQGTTERSQHATRDLKLIEERLSRLTDAVIDGVIDKATYEERKATLLFERRELRDRVENASDMTFWQNVADKFERGLTAYVGYEVGTEEEKRAIVQSVGSNLVVRQKEPEFPLYFPFNEIRDHSNSRECAPHQRAVRTGSVRGRQKRRRCSAHALFRRIARHRSEHDASGRSPSHP